MAKRKQKPKKPLTPDAEFAESALGRAVADFVHTARAVIKRNRPDRLLRKDFDTEAEFWKAKRADFSASVTSVLAGVPLVQELVVSALLDDLGLLQETVDIRGVQELEALMKNALPRLEELVATRKAVVREIQFSAAQLPLFA